MIYVTLSIIFIVLLLSYVFVIKNLIELKKLKLFKQEEALDIWKSIISTAKDFHVDKGFWVIDKKTENHLAVAYKKLLLEFKTRIKEILQALEHPNELVRTNAYNLINEDENDIIVRIDLKKSRGNIFFPKICSLCLCPIDYKTKWNVKDMPVYSTNIVHYDISIPLCSKHNFIPIKNPDKSNFFLFFSGVLLSVMIYSGLIICFPSILLLLKSENVYLKLVFALLTLGFFVTGIILGWFLEKRELNKEITVKDLKKYLTQPVPVIHTLLPGQIDFRIKNPSYAMYFSEANKQHIID